MNSKRDTREDFERPEPDGSDGVAATERAAVEALADLLSLAYDPPDLSPRTQEQLLSLAFDDPLAQASDVERTAARRLRSALDGGPTSCDADLAVSLAFAAGKVGCDVGDAVERAVVRAGLPSARRTNVVFVAFGAAAVATAAAAALVLSLYPADRPPLATAPAAQPAMISSHSTAPLFQERFEVGKASERVDLIVAARSRELRANRFAAWGIR
jgi:hypothetical protein